MIGEPDEPESRRAPASVTQLMRRSFPGHFSIERIFAQVRPALETLGYDVDVVVTPYYSKRLMPRLRTAWEARRLAAPVVHITGDITYAGLLRSRRGTVLTVHDTEFLERASWSKRLIYTWFWLRLPVRRADVVTVPTEATRRDVLAHVRVAPEKIRVVPNPVADELIEPPSSPRPLPVPHSSRPTVLLVGSRPNKNLPGSIAALAGLDCRVVIVGEADADQRAAIAASGLDVDVRTDLDDEALRECYAECDLLLFPSTKEGFGIPILEAQAMGRPVVTSTRAPLPEVAGAGGACLVDPSDPVSIRAGVERVLAGADYRAELVRQGWANVALYRVATVAAAYAAIYDEVARRS